MTDHYHDEMGQPITAFFGNASPDEIRERTLQHFQQMKSKAFSSPPDYVDVVFAAGPQVQAMERRIAERGHGPGISTETSRQIIVLLVIVAILLGGFFAAGLIGGMRGLAISSIIPILILASVAAGLSGREYGYQQAMYVGAYDSLSEVEYALRQERERHAEAELRRREMEAECDLALDLNAPSNGEGFIYVLGFATGVVKVGQTVDPARRIREHRRDAAVFGVNLVSFWVSPAHRNYLGNEASLIAACLAVSDRSRKEYFNGIAFVEAVRIAGGLTFYSNDLTGRSCRGGHHD